MLSAGRLLGRRWWPEAGLIAVLIFHSVSVMRRFAPAISMPDANGYWAQGSRLFLTGHVQFLPESDLQFVGMPWLLADSGAYFSRYPFGLPALIAAVYGTLGAEAAVLINPILASLTLAGVFVLSGGLLGRGWALAPVVVLATNPLFNQQAVWCFSHMAVTALLVWGLVWLIRGVRRDAVGASLLGGALLGGIAAVRYPDAIFALGIGTFLLWDRSAWGDRAKRAVILSAVGGAMVPVAAVLIANQIFFGAWYRTAYALTGEQTGFSLSYLRVHLIPYIQNLHNDGLGLFFGVGILGMAGMCRDTAYRRYGVLFVLLVVPSLLLYMAYYFLAPALSNLSSGNLRFLLPTFIVYIIAGTWFFRKRLEEASKRRQVIGMVAVLLLQMLWGDLGRSPGSALLRHQKLGFTQATRALDAHIAPGDIVIADPQLLQHLDYVGQWRLVSPISLRPPLYHPRPDRDRQVGPSPLQSRKLRRQAERTVGRTPDQNERQSAVALRRWAGAQDIYFIGTAEDLARMDGKWFNPAAFESIARVPLTRPPVTIRPGEDLGLLAYMATARELVIARWTPQPR